jgi:hypothetical protein
MSLGLDEREAAPPSLPVHTSDQVERRIAMRYTMRAILFTLMTAALLFPFQNLAEAGFEKGSMKSGHQGSGESLAVYRQGQTRDLSSIESQRQKRESGANVQDPDKVNSALPISSEEQDCGCDSNIRREWEEMMRNSVK